MNFALRQRRAPSAVGLTVAEGDNASNGSDVEVFLPRGPLIPAGGGDPIDWSVPSEDEPEDDAGGQAFHWY
jgi:hypothetical protein